MCKAEQNSECVLTNRVETALKSLTPDLSVLHPYPLELYFHLIYSKLTS